MEKLIYQSLAGDFARTDPNIFIVNKGETIEGIDELLKKNDIAHPGSQFIKEAEIMEDELSNSISAKIANITNSLGSALRPADSAKMYRNLAEELDSAGAALLDERDRLLPSITQLDNLREVAIKYEERHKNKESGFGSSNKKYSKDYEAGQLAAPEPEEGEDDEDEDYGDDE